MNSLTPLTYIVFLLLCTCCTSFSQSKDKKSTSVQTTPLIVAHRGASKDAPENTLPAFELAWVQNADAIEADFHLTKDKQVVCIHDEDTEKVANKTLIVAESTLAELKQLDVGSYHSDQFKGVTIPTFAEVAATIPKGKKFYIEIKSDKKIISYLFEEIKKSGLKADQIIFISFSKEALTEIKNQAPQYKVFWLSNFKFNILGKYTPSLKTVLASLKAINADGFSSSRKKINQNFVNKVIAAGYEHHVWTVNDKETAQRFQSWGTKSITTDVPGKIKASLIQK